MTILTKGNHDAEIIVVCDPPSTKELEFKTPITGKKEALFTKKIIDIGIKKSSIAFISCSPEPIPEHISTPGQKQSFIKDFRDEFSETLTKFTNAKLIVGFGSLPCYQVKGKSISIQNFHGKLLPLKEKELNLFVMIGPSQVLVRPETTPLFDSDIRLLKKLYDCNWDSSVIERDIDYGEQSWCDDLQFLIDLKPPAIAIDTETTGLDWFRGVKLITVQFTYPTQDGALKSIAVCVNKEYSDKYMMGLTQETIDKLLTQVKVLCEDESLKKIAHNMKYDAHILRNHDIRLKNWYIDTMQLAKLLDNNSNENSLDSVVKRWLPLYSKLSSPDIDRANMMNTPPEKMLEYGCQDTYITYMVARVMMSVAMADKKSLNVFTKIQMPGLAAFCTELERNGFFIDVNQLQTFSKELVKRKQEIEKELYRLLPQKTIDFFLSKNKTSINFGSSKQLQVILFSRCGLKLSPVMFTSKNKKIPKHLKIPTTSSEHLEKFSHNPFVALLLEYKAISKMVSTYVGEKEKGTGFYKFIYESFVRPSYWLHITATQRSSSSNPNGQNFPKHGELASTHRKMFRSRPGYKLLALDHSQAELRVLADVTGDESLIEAYRTGQDIHVKTAAAMYRVREDEVTKEQRNGGKTLNFALVYQQGAHSTAQKLGVDKDEAEKFMNQYFKDKPKVLQYIEGVKKSAHTQGFVRSFLGSKYLFPSIRSDEDYVVAEVERHAVNYPIQGAASNFGVIAIHRIARDNNKRPKELSDELRMIGFIHDAIIFEVKEEKAEEYASNIKWYMENLPIKEWFDHDFKVPLVADIEMGYNLKEMESYQDLTAIKPNWFTSDEEIYNG
jgi:DNA polymerase I